MSNKMSWFWQLGEDERRLDRAKKEHDKHNKIMTYAATHPAYKGTVLQARHGGEKDADR